VRSARDPVVQDYFEQLIERIPLMMFTKLEIETKLSPDDFNHGHLIAINTFPAQPPTFGSFIMIYVFISDISEDHFLQACYFTCTSIPSTIRKNFLMNLEYISSEAS